MGGSDKRTFSSFKALRDVAGTPEDQRQPADEVSADENEYRDYGPPGARPNPRDEWYRHATANMKSAEGIRTLGSVLAGQIRQLRDEGASDHKEPESDPGPEFVDVPKGMVAVSTCSIGDDFWFVRNIVRTDRAYILFPDSIVETVPDRVPGPGGIVYTMGDKDVVRFSAIKAADHGWREVKGLPCGGSCEHGTHWKVLTIRHRGCNLVPPPGLWPSDLPYRIVRRLIKPDAWVDIFARNRDRLAYEQMQYCEYWGRIGFATVRVCASDWCIHDSRQGVQALLEKCCGGRLVVDRQSETAQIFVPPDQVGTWIGKDGRVVRQLKPILGVVKIDVIGDPNIPPLPD